MAKVYVKGNTEKSGGAAIFSRLIKEAGIKEGDKVCLKVHFGEEGNTRYIKPELILPFAEGLKKAGCSMFVSDCNTLYKGRRVSGDEHRNLALEHGFGKLGMPIVIGDGQLGKDEYSQPIKGAHYNSVWLGSAYKDIDTLILISHFKGHVMCGFGGAIKNAGMGMASRRGKMEMHASMCPNVKEDACTRCSTCIENCDVKAISLTEKAVKIDREKCVGCAMCISVCPSGAIGIPWGSTLKETSTERTAEYALGAVTGKKVIAVNFIMDITKNCDCLTDSRIISEDVGIAGSLDIVSLDKASYDMVVERNKGADVFRKAHGVDPLHIIRHAQRIGLGIPDYELVKL